MSEYQYYEFLAIDRPLAAAARDALRALSSRARITATSFVNTYNFGDFHGSPEELMRRWFDVHLYLANWGSRRLMMRFPAALLDAGACDAFLAESDEAKLERSGDDLVLDISRVEVDADGPVDGEGCLAALAPLRADVLGGDLRLFYLIWLMAMEADIFLPDEPEPLPGLGPMTGALEAFADFFAIDSDLVAAAAERPWSGSAVAGDPAGQAVRAAIEALPKAAKTDMLVRLFEGAPNVGAELRAEIRKRLPDAGTKPPMRTVGELRARAEAIAQERARAEAERKETERRRAAETAEKERQERLTAIARRGEYVWHDAEAEIERRNATAYDKATSLLVDLHAVAEARGTLADFSRRMAEIRARHAGKGKFIERVEGLGG